MTTFWMMKYVTPYRPTLVNPNPMENINQKMIARMIPFMALVHPGRDF